MFGRSICRLAIAGAATTLLVLAQLPAQADALRPGGLLGVPDANLVAPSDGATAGYHPVLKAAYVCENPCDNGAMLFQVRDADGSVVISGSVPATSNTVVAWAVPYEPRGGFLQNHHAYTWRAQASNHVGSSSWTPARLITVSTTQWWGDRDQALADACTQWPKDGTHTPMPGDDATILKPCNLDGAQFRDFDTGSQKFALNIDKVLDVLRYPKDIPKVITGKHVQRRQPHLSKSRSPLVNLTSWYYSPCYSGTDVFGVTLYTLCVNGSFNWDGYAVSNPFDAIQATISAPFWNWTPTPSTPNPGEIDVYQGWGSNPTNGLVNDTVSGSFDLCLSIGPVQGCIQHDPYSSTTVEFADGTFQ
jgi:hypothetical protein